MPVLGVQVDADLRWLLPARARRPHVEVEVAPTDTLGHVVQSLGVPLTEVGTLLLDGHPADRAQRCDAHPGSSTLVVLPRPRPQPTATTPPRFLLDVHLGTLARRLRLLGLDTAYEPNAEDVDLVRRAVEERRVLLTRDRGLLRRTAVPEGALVRGDGAGDQLDDVLQRFAPPLAPWTRCVRCNGMLTVVDKADVHIHLQPGTRRTYRDFMRCNDCGRVYWRGAHSTRLEALVRQAQAALDRHTGTAGPGVRGDADRATVGARTDPLSSGPRGHDMSITPNDDLPDAAETDDERILAHQEDAWAESATGEPVPQDADLPEVAPDEERIVEPDDVLEEGVEEV
jgi:uncharacterized protein